MGKAMLKYGINLRWSDEDQAFIARVPELPGCMAHGEDPQSALDQVTEAMKLWIETARETGGPVPRPEGESINPS